MKGDGFQNGGALVVKAGKCLGRLCPHVDMQDRIVLTNETMHFSTFDFDKFLMLL